MPVDVPGAVNNQNSAIQKVYADLQGNLQNGVNTTGNIFGGAQPAISGAYDQGSADIAKYTNDLSARLAKSAAALGLGSADSMSQNHLAATLASRGTGMAMQKTTALSNLAQQKADYQGIGQMGVASSQSEGARAMIEMANRLQKILYDSNAKEEGYKSNVDLARLKNEADRARGDRELQSSKYAGDIQIRQAEMSMAERAQARQDAQEQRAYERAQRKLAEDKPLTDKEIMQLQSLGYDIDLKKQQLEKNAYDAANPKEGALGKPTDFGDGEIGAQRYASANGVDGATWDAFRKLTSQTDAQASRNSMAGLPFDSYNADMNAIPSFKRAGSPAEQFLGRGVGGIDLNALRIMAGIYRNKAHSGGAYSQYEYEEDN